MLFILYSSFYAQSHFPLSDSALSGFYVTAVQSYCDTFMRAWKMHDENGILLGTKINRTLLPSKDARNSFIWFHADSGLHSVLSRPFKKNVNRSIYYVSHLNKGPDTVDVNISSERIVFINRRKIHLARHCGGDMGYIPEARFIYDRNKKCWNYLCRESLREERMNEDLRRLGREPINKK